MSHSALNRGLMLEWITDCILEDRAMPTDADIMERFNFTAVEQARTLLADLADRGSITIRGVGAGRAITLGRAKPVMEAARPLPTVRRIPSEKPLARDNAETIREILARSIATPQRPRPVPAPIPELEMKRQPTVPARAVRPAQPTEPKKQLNIHMPGALFAAIAVQAEAKGQTPSAYLRELLEQHVNGSSAAAPAPTDKPRIKYAVAAAALREGVPLGSFLTRLIELGFAVYEEDTLAEAAE